MYQSTHSSSRVLVPVHLCVVKSGLLLGPVLLRQLLPSKSPGQLSRLHLMSFCLVSAGQGVPVFPSTPSPRADCRLAQEAARSFPNDSFPNDRQTRVTGEVFDFICVDLVKKAKMFSVLSLCPGFCYCSSNISPSIEYSRARVPYPQREM